MRILIVTLLNIGDVLFTTPAMRSVRAAYPDAEIDVLVKKLAVDTVAHSPIFTNVFSFDTKAEGKSPSAMLKLLRRIRARRYDLLVSLHAAARVTLITAFGGAKRKVGLVSRKFEWVMDQPAIQKTGMHMVGSYLEVLRDVGITPIEDAPMEMFVDSESQAAADEMWRSADLAVQEVIGLNPGSRAAKKTWPARNWASLADLVNRSGSRAIIFGGPEDISTSQAIASAMKTESPSFAGRLSLLQLAAMASKCAAFVSSDTGPMHIAASQGTPVIALYGPSDPSVYGPRGTKSIVIKSGRPCPGCINSLDDPAQHTCMSDITVEQVFDAVTRVQDQATPQAESSDTP